MSEDPQRGTKLQEKNEMLKDSFGTEKEVYLIYLFIYLDVRLKKGKIKAKRKGKKKRIEKK